jgi:hypothetical protein
MDGMIRGEGPSIFTLYFSLLPERESKARGGKSKE